ncbi:hypothetical protein D3C87_579190 [compost metagenome]
MTTKVINRIRCRCGITVPFMTKGMESAAARETTPRIPVQPSNSGIKKRCFEDRALGATLGRKISVAIIAA